MSEKLSNIIKACGFYKDISKAKSPFNGEDEKKSKSKLNNKYIKPKNKKGNYTFINKILPKKYLLINKLLIIINLSVHIISNDESNFIFNLSNITLKVKGIGPKNIFGQEYFGRDHYPDIIYINGEKQNEIKKTYNFNETENFVELFWNKSIGSCAGMFYGCSDITEMTFINFDTSLVHYMGFMFCNCSSLISLNNISNLNTKNVNSMRCMFNGCSLLTSLNLSGFNTPNLKRIYQMFDGCINLKYINLKNFNEIRINTDPNEYKDIFNNVPEDVVICINENNTQNKIYPQIKSKKCFNNDCSEDWKSKQRKVIDKINNCECELNDCLSCANLDLGLNKKICTKCSNNYYPKENENQIEGKYFNCYNALEGYYLDKTDSIYKKCYHSCETCEINGDNINHNCLICNGDYSFKYNLNNHTNYFNCYESCEYYHYFDEEYKYHCTMSESCPDDYSKLIIDEKECIKEEKFFYETTETNNKEISTLLLKDYFSTIIFEQVINKSNNIILPVYHINNIIEEIKNKEKNETEIKDKEEVIKYYNQIKTDIETIFTSENYDTTNIDKGEDQIIETKNMKITLTSTQNQKNNSNTNLTIIDLGYCETLLRNHYNISDDEIIYMEKIDIIQEGMKIPKIEYNVFCKLSGNNLTKLNISICKDNKIYLSIPIELNENLDKLNTSSDYFNDICYKSTSDSGTDISLKDRQKEFIEGNKTICQDECNFSKYNQTTQKANCTCQVKESSNSFVDMNINRTNLYQNFENSNNKNSFSNLGVASCNILSSKENIESNIGFFLLLIIVVLFIIIFIIFCTRGRNMLEDKMDEVIYKKFKNEIKNKKNKTKKSLINETIITSKKKKKSKSKKSNENKIIKNSATSQNIIFNRTIRNDSKNNKDNNNLIKNFSKTFENKINKRKKSEVNKNKPDTDYEYNWLSYEDAIKFDKRSNCDYYSSLIKSKQLFIFTFCSFNDYNSGIIKKFMFFLSFALHYTSNALFFTESTMHQIYEDEGKFNFEYQIPKIIYSALISTFALRIMLQTLILTDKDVLEVKNQQKKDKAIDMKKKKLKCILIKYTIFFFLNLALLGLFWFYLTCFNAIYQNTQVYLIENTFISFGFSLFYPFIINIFPTMIRSCSLHSINKEQKYFYKLSQIIQLI